MRAPPAAPERRPCCASSCKSLARRGPATPRLSLLCPRERSPPISALPAPRRAPTHVALRELAAARTYQLRCCSLRDGGERPALEHRVIPVGVARHDYVIEDRDAEDLAGEHDVLGRRDILPARSGVAGWMIVPLLLSPLLCGVNR